MGDLLGAVNEVLLIGKAMHKQFNAQIYSFDWTSSQRVRKFETTVPKANPS
jgi:hypothetical protein